MSSKKYGLYDFSPLAPASFFGAPSETTAMGAKVFFRTLFKKVPRILGIFNRSQYIFTEREIKKAFITLRIIDRAQPDNEAGRAVLETFLPCKDSKTYLVHCDQTALVTKIMNRDGVIKYRVWIHGPPCHLY